MIGVISSDLHRLAVGSLHDQALALLHPGVVLLVEGMDQGIGLLMLIDVVLQPAGVSF